jgi:hypothetical protein
MSPATHTRREAEVLVRCPACGARASRMQRGAPQPRPGVFAVYPCQCWLVPEAAERLRAAYRQAVDARSAEVQAASRTEPVVSRSAETQDPWTG